MSTERDIGELKEQAKWIASRLEKMDHKIDKLIEFKWKVLGASLTVAFLSSIAIELLRR